MPLEAAEREQIITDALAAINQPGAAPDIARQVMEGIGQRPGLSDTDKQKICDDVRKQWVAQQTPALLAGANGPGGTVQACQNVLQSPDYRAGDKAQLVGALVHGRIDNAVQQAVAANNASDDKQPEQAVRSAAVKAEIKAIIQDIEDAPGLSADQKRDMQADVLAGCIGLDKDPSVDIKLGGEIFAAIEDSDALTPDQKADLCCKMGARIVAQECAEAQGQPHTLLRGNNAGTNFMSAFMNEHGADYFNAVKNAGLQAARQAQAAGLDPAQKQYAAAQAMMTAMTTQAQLLEGPAANFLQATSQAARNAMPPDQAQAAVDKVMANTVALRGVCPAIIAESGVARRNAQIPPQEQAAHAVLFEAARGVQQFANVGGGGNVMGNKAECFDLIVEDEELGEEFNNTLDLMSQGHQFPPPPVQQQAAPVVQQQAAPVVEQQANPDANALNEGAEKKSRLASVRDALRGAAGKIQDAAHDLGAGIKDKIEQAKLVRLDKQVQKRQDHGAYLQEQKDFADHVSRMSPEGRERLLADLQDKIDPDKLLKGDRQERAAQMQLMDQIEACKMSPEKLDQRSAKLQEKLDKNEEKLGRQEQKRDAQKAKVDLRAARHANAQQQPQQAHAHGH